MLHGLSDQQTSEFCSRDSVRSFAEFAPHIMNHDTLLKRRYDPLHITADLRKEASEEHRQLANAFERFSKSPEDLFLKEAVLKKTATLIYVVRSNIAHSEKTPQGPDRAKSHRDREVSELTAKVIADVFDILFERPSKRLAVYGTLAPDKANASQLAGLDGHWDDGSVSGTINEKDGFLEFYWTLNPTQIAVRVFSADELGSQMERLDRFEGPRYQRIHTKLRSTFVGTIQKWSGPLFERLTRNSPIG